jgi:hypothetical protein
MDSKGESMTDDFEMCPDEKHEILEDVMRLKGDIVDSMNELNSSIIELASKSPAISEEKRTEIIELMTSMNEKQNAPTELDVLYLKSCLDRGIVNPDSFNQLD